jgi:hypothetical protein
VPGGFFEKREPPMNTNVQFREYLILLLCFAGVFSTTYATDSVVTFNEIMYHPANEADATVEWVELCNQMALDIDISGWSVKGAIKYTFPEGTIMPGGGYVVLAISPTSLETASGYSGALGAYGKCKLIYKSDAA